MSKNERNTKDCSLIEPRMAKDRIQWLIFTFISTIGTDRCCKQTFTVVYLSRNYKNRCPQSAHSCVAQILHG